MKKKKINFKLKGDVGEREFITEMKLVCDVEFKRNQDQAAYGGHDIVVAKRRTPLARFIDDRYAIEVKRRNKIKPSMLIDFWEQTRKQALKIERYPLLAYREDYRGWRMLIPIMWKEDKTIDGTGDFSLFGACRYLDFERKQYNYD